MHLLVCVKNHRLTRYLQTKTLTKTARRTLPMSRKTLKGSNSSESELPSSAGFSLVSWPRSFMASSKRERYDAGRKPRRGEALRSSDGRSPLGLRRMPPMSSSEDPPVGSLESSGRGEPLLSGVELWEWLPIPGDGLGEAEDDHGSKGRWNRGSVGRRDPPDEEDIIGY